MNVYDNKQTKVMRKAIKILLLLILTKICLLNCSLQVVRSQSVTDPCQNYGTDPTSTKCIQCKAGWELTLLSNDRVLCSPSPTLTLSCQLDTYYATRLVNPANDPGNLVLYTLTGGQKYCYSCLAVGSSDVESAFGNCKKCGDETFSVASQSASETAALKKSTGCAVCEDGFFQEIREHPTITGLYLRECVPRLDPVSKAGQLCNWSSVFKYDPTFDETYRSHDGSLVCADCSEAIPGCSWCSSGQTCLECEPNTFLVTSVGPQGSKPTCFFNFCGNNHQGVNQQTGVCSTCTITNCQECLFDLVGSEKCLQCEPGFAMNPNQLSCHQQTGISQLDLYVIPFEGVLMSPSELSAQQSTSATLGESLTSPYAFIQQVFNQITNQKLATLSQYTSVDITVHLGKGNHYFFSCVSGEMADLTSYGASVTDFCNDIPSLEADYYPYDNLKFTFKPLDCSIDPLTFATPAEQTIFTNNCVDLSATAPEKPQLFINSQHTYFNITNEATFEDINFAGNDNFAIYAEAPNVNKPVQEFPTQLCQVTTDPNDHHGMTLTALVVAPFKYECFKPTDMSEGLTRDRSCSQKLGHTKRRCGGEPYSEEYFKFYPTTGGPSQQKVALKRRQVLFNIYSFDSYHTLAAKTPKITIQRCKFENFLSGKHEALIQVETTNLFAVPRDSSIADGKGFIKQLGANTGVIIQIYDTDFSFSRFCKGTIVYRPFTNYATLKQGVWGFQAEFDQSNTPPAALSCPTCKIEIQNSNFKQMNYGTELGVLSQLLDYLPSVRNATKADSSGLIAGEIYAPDFQNFGSILNIEDFPGAISIIESHFERNIINVRDLGNVVQDRSSVSDRSQLEILNHHYPDYYFDEEYGVYELLVCGVGLRNNAENYLLQDGIVANIFNGEPISDYFHGAQKETAIYVARNQKPVIFRQNTFTENVGLIGGAVLINSPNFRLKNALETGTTSETATLSSSEKPYIIFYNNQFVKNMAYLAGNALFVAGARGGDEKLKACSAGLLMDQNIFQQNFGTKISDGGAVGLACYLKISDKHKDYVGSSAIAANFTPQDSLVTAIPDPITPGTLSYQPMFRTALLQKNQFDENLAGLSGSSLFIKGITAVKISGDSFKNNKAVDSVQEKNMLPVYTRLILGYDPLIAITPPQNLFTLNLSSAQKTSCGDTEIEFMTNCATQSSLIPQSYLKGAIYLQGAESQSCTSNTCSEEVYTIENCIFQSNEIGYSYLPIRDFLKQSSDLYIKNLRTVNVNQSQFLDHLKSGAYKNLVVSKLPNLYSFFPSNYFDYSHASLVFIEQSDLTSLAGQTSLQKQFGVFFTQNVFRGNNAYQLLGFGPEYYFKGSLIHVESGDILVNSLIQMKLNKVELSRAIGPETSLIYFEKLTKVDLQGNSFDFNGRVTSDTFSTDPNISIASLGGATLIYRLQEMSLMQEFGMIYSNYVGLMKTNGNSFKFCGAMKGTAFYNNETPFRGQFNQFENMVASVGGSVMRSTGIHMYHALSNEVVVDTIGVAYDIRGDQTDQLQESHGFFEKMFMKNCVGEDVGFMRLERAGTLQILEMEAKIDSTLTAEDVRVKFNSNAAGRPLMLDTAFLVTLFPGVLNSIAPFEIKETYYEGDDLTFTVGDETFQSAPVTKKGYVWIKHSIFTNLIGGKSGVFFVTNQSKVYLSNNDQILTNRRLLQESYEEELVEETDPDELPQFKNTDNDDKRRRLDISFYQSENNKGSIGSGFLRAEDNSDIIFRGQNLQKNQGFAGGTISLYQSKFFAEQTYISQSISQTFGGSIYAADSHFNIELSALRFAYAQDAAVIYSIGSHQTEKINRLDGVSISNNLGERNLIQNIHSILELEDVTFLDNHVNAGTNGINAIGGILNLRRTKSIGSIEVFTQVDFRAESGFLTMSGGTQLTMVTTTISLNKGSLASVLHSIGPNRIEIRSCSFQQNIGDRGSPAFNIFGAETVRIIESNFDGHQGGSVFKLHQSVVRFESCQFRQSQQQRFILAVQSFVVVFRSQFFQSGSLNLLGGAIYCDCDGIEVIGSQFQDNLAASGGALYLLGRNEGTIRVSESSFLGNRAQQGGAIAIITVEKAKITNNVFTNNQAFVIDPPTVTSVTLPSTKAQGGAVFNFCPPVFDQKCEVTLTGNVFENNQAETEGGATIWLNKPFLEDPNAENRYFNNPAEYDDGTGKANYAKFLRFHSISNNDVHLIDDVEPKEMGKQMGKDALTLNNWQVVSGTPLSFNINITDHLGELVRSENLANAKYRILDQEQENTVSLLGQDAIAIEGVFNFTGMTIVTQPGSRIILELTVNMKQEGSNLPLFARNERTTVQVRPCYKGEEFTQDERCVRCAPGTYLLEAPTEVRSCKPCPENSVCLGGDHIAPKASFWRSDLGTIKFIQCLNADACLEGDLNHLTSNCAEGYSGPLCSQCVEPDYYPFGKDNSCHQCNSNYFYPLFVAMVIAVPLICAILATWISISNSLIEINPQNYFPAICKILSTHVQLVFVFSRILTVIQKNHVVARGTLQAQSGAMQIFTYVTRCFLRQFNQNFDFVPLLAERILWLILPLATLFCGVLIQIGYLLYVRRFNTSLMGIYQVVNAAYHLMYIEVAFQLFSSLDCIEFEGKRVLAEDLTRQCFTAGENGYWKFLVIYMLPSALIWILIIPTVKFCVLRGNRKKIQRLNAANWVISDLNIEMQTMLQRTQFLFGFALNGLRSPTYFWSSLQHFRDTFSLVIYFAMHAFSWPSESIMLALTCYFAVFLVLQIRVEPYKEASLNRIETVSLMCFILYLMAEIQGITQEANGFAGGYSGKTIAILMVCAPSCTFFLLSVRYLRKQAMSMSFYTSRRLFKLVSCGLKSLDHYATNQVKDEEKGVDFDQKTMPTERQQLVQESNRKSARKVAGQQYVESDYVNPEQIKMRMRRGIKNMMAASSSKKLIEKEHALKFSTSQGKKRPVNTSAKHKRIKSNQATMGKTAQKLNFDVQMATMDSDRRRLNQSHDYMSSERRGEQISQISYIDNYGTNQGEAYALGRGEDGVMKTENDLYQAKTDHRGFEVENGSFEDDDENVIESGQKLFVKKHNNQPLKQTSKKKHRPLDLVKNTKLISQEEYPEVTDDNEFEFDQTTRQRPIRLLNPTNLKEQTNLSDQMPPTRPPTNLNQIEQISPGFDQIQTGTASTNARRQANNLYETQDFSSQNDEQANVSENSEEEVRSESASPWGHNLALGFQKKFNEVFSRRQTNVIVDSRNDNLALYSRRSTERIREELKEAEQQDSIQQQQLVKRKQLPSIKSIGNRSEQVNFTENTLVDRTKKQDQNVTMQTPGTQSKKRRKKKVPSQTSSFEMNIGRQEGAKVKIQTHDLKDQLSSSTNNQDQSSGELKSLEKAGENERNLTQQAPKIVTQQNLNKDSSHRSEDAIQSSLNSSGERQNREKLNTQGLGVSTIRRTVLDTDNNRSTFNRKDSVSGENLTASLSASKIGDDQVDQSRNVKGSIMKAITEKFRKN